MEFQGPKFASPYKTQATSEDLPFFDILGGDPLYHRWNHHNNMGKFGFEQYKIMKLASKPRTCLAKIGASIVINKGFFHQTAALIQKLGIQNRTNVHISDCNQERLPSDYTASYGDIHHEKRQIIHQKKSRPSSMIEWLPWVWQPT